MHNNLQYLTGAWQAGQGGRHTQHDVYSGEPYSVTHLSSRQDVELAIASASQAAPLVEGTPSHERSRWLAKAADSLEKRREAIAGMLVAECGKPLSIALGEVDRSVETLRFSSCEALRVAGEMIPMQASKRGEGRMGFYVRVPVGVVAAITPFNAPLNLLCHKLGPALAAGNSVVVKPDPRTASCTAEVFSIFHELDLPPGTINLVHGGAAVGEQLVCDDRIGLVSFTGGKRAAHSIVQQAGLKRVLLELGGNAGNIVLEDADLDVAAKQLALDAFTHAGQSCIGVQRIYVQESAYAAFLSRFLDNVDQIVVGDPSRADTEVGPMMDDASVDRIMSWIGDAVRHGAIVQYGGIREGSMLTPTVLTNVDRSMQIVCEEVFGPVVTIDMVRSVQEAIDAVNDSRYGLQAGVFTASLRNALSCVRQLKVGGVVVNGTSNYRVDHQPYGGVKQSGLGREGPAFAIEEMTEIRMVVLQ